MGRRIDKARELFAAWVGVSRHPELVAAMWNNLSAEDRQAWLDRADADDAA